MEAKLRDYIITSEPDKFSIRAIECRTSLCAVEVASPYGQYLGGTFDYMASIGLFKELPAFGYETNEHSARVTVTVQMYERL